jgi:starch synthase (maltosyl-transferring)
VRPLVAIESVSPVVDGGRFAAKAVVGDDVVVEADVFAHGHERVAGRVEYRHVGEGAWRAVRLEPLDNDRWRAAFPATSTGTYEFSVKAWPDELATWAERLGRRVAAGQDVRTELEIGAQIVERACKRVKGAERKALQAWVTRLRKRAAPPMEEVEQLVTLGWSAPDPDQVVATERAYPVMVERPLAACSAWYELFPRSASPDPTRAGTLRDVEARLAYVAELGFDVLYLPPIHPIGRKNRKGRNNTTTAEPDDVGSPWAIGSADGGHTEIAPELGTLEDFAALLATARELGVEVALDLAFQCAPDHPWVAEHPEWFRHAPDGSIAYAENPPKRYEDIVPFDFESEAWPELWQALLDVVRTWVERGVRVFRVDNPHTKPFAFWEWLLAEVRRTDPDVIFLSEAFTRPKVMHRLAKLGFSQSYTYFTWRETRDELRDYFTELAFGPGAVYFRPNVWPNTPDILPEHLQSGRRSTFVGRLVLASLLSANYGMYGPVYELMVHEPREAGSEEYLHSEKYEVHHWDLDSPSSLRHIVARLNRIRREHPALQRNDGLHFHHVDDDRLLCWSKSSADGKDAVLVVVNLDPVEVRSGWLWLDLGPLGLVGDQPFTVHDQLTGASYSWYGNSNFVRLDPSVVPAHVFTIEPGPRPVTAATVGR